MTTLQALELLRKRLSEEQHKPAYDVSRNDTAAGITFDFKMGIVTAYGKAILEIDNLIVEVCK